MLDKVFHMSSFELYISAELRILPLESQLLARKEISLKLNQIEILAHLSASRMTKY